MPPRRHSWHQLAALCVAKWCAFDCSRRAVFLSWFNNTGNVFSFNLKKDDYYYLWVWVFYFSWKGDLGIKKVSVKCEIFHFPFSSGISKDYNATDFSFYYYTAVFQAVAELQDQLIISQKWSTSKHHSKVLQRTSGEDYLVTSKIGMLEFVQELGMYVYIYIYK